MPQTKFHADEAGTQLVGIQINTIFGNASQDFCDSRRSAASLSKRM